MSDGKEHPQQSSKVGDVDMRTSRHEDSAAAETMKTPHQDKAAQRGTETSKGGAPTVSGETAGALKDQVGH
ncbi:MAG: hypothetical protein K2X11_15730 [Acetobacteraceae bacterium]|nr:hypothetical protein [Acetobacteraceae bacterium]